MIVNRSKTNTYFQSLIIWVSFLQTLHFKLLSFGVLVLISSSLIVDFFVRVNWVRVHWPWNFSSGVIANFMCSISKLYTHIWFPYSIVEGCGEGACWLYLLVETTWLICFIKNLPQVIHKSLFLLIVYLFILHLLNQRSFIMKIFLGCDYILSVRRIYTIYMCLLPL